MTAKILQLLVAAALIPVMLVITVGAIGFGIWQAGVMTWQLVCNTWILWWKEYVVNETQEEE